MYVKCKPEKISEKIKEIVNLFGSDNFIIEKIQMSESAWNNIFGTERPKDVLVNISVEFTNDSGNYAIIHLCSCKPKTSNKKKSIRK